MEDVCDDAGWRPGIARCPLPYRKGDPVPCHEWFTQKRHEKKTTNAFLIPVLIDAKEALEKYE